VVCAGGGGGRQRVAPPITQGRRHTSLFSQAVSNLIHKKKTEIHVTLIGHRVFSKVRLMEPEGIRDHLAIEGH